jgi:hypothetical protein
MLKSAAAGIALLALANPALISPALAAGCASPADAAALKTAVIQQELMVAAFQCHEAGAYNRFVTTYRGELQSSDAALKSFFIRRDGRRGEDGYDSFKTKAANLWGLEQARHADAFCAEAHALYGAAFANQGSLMSFVESREANIGNICVESRPVLARTDAKPEKGVKVAGVPSYANVEDVSPPRYYRQDDTAYRDTPPRWRDYPPPPPPTRWYPRGYDNR